MFWCLREESLKLTHQAFRVFGQLKQLTVFDLTYSDRLVLFAISEKTKFQIIGQKEACVTVISLHLVSFFNFVQIGVNVFGFCVTFDDLVVRLL